MKRIRFTDENGRQEFVIPSTKNWFFIVVFAPFIVVWVAVELFIPILIVANLSSIFFFGAWFVGWTAIGLLLVKTWIWEAFGKTILNIQDHQLIIKKRFDIVSSRKQIKLAGITDLTILDKDVERTGYMVRPNYLFSKNTKSIIFHYGFSKIIVVDWINQEEAELIIKILSESIEKARPYKNQSGLPLFLNKDKYHG